MANSKKSASSRKATGTGTRTSTQKSSKKSTAARKKTPAVTASAAKRPVRREVWSAVCLFLAIAEAFGFFNFDALLINLVFGLAQGLIGWGSYILAPMLVAMSAILAFHRGRPVRLRVSCCLLIAVAAGAFAQLLGKAPTAEGWAIISELYLNGTSGGGVIAGLFALGLKYVCSAPLAAVVLSVGTLILVYVAFRVQVTAIVSYIIRRRRERPSYELPPEPEREDVLYIAEEDTRRSSDRRTKPMPAHSHAGRVIDIPVDGERDESRWQRDADDGRGTAEPVEDRRNRGSLLRRRPESVRTPDEVLLGSRDNGQEQVSHSEEVERVMRGRTDAVELVPEPVPQQKNESQPMPAHVSESEPELKPKRERETGHEPVSVSEPELEFEPEHGTETEQNDEPVEAQGRSEEEISAVAARALEAAAGGYAYPPIELLDEPVRPQGEENSAELKASAMRLIDTIKSFGIEVKLVNVTRGPSVTRYEFEMDRGVKLTKLTGLSEDIALSLGASGVRIAPIPDKVAVVGVEVPNKVVSTVYLREIIASREFQNSKSKVAFAVGRDIGGESIVSDIARLPHLLIAGTTGSGKSVCMNSLIISLLYRSRPDEVRLIMVDPKMIELNIYNGIPHLLIPVVTDPKKASGALQWAVSEMMKRYKLFAEHNVRDFASFNAYAERSGGEVEKIPQIVILIDELADLMLVAAKEVEESICRIAQMARAAGMHLVIATQSPRADVITGIMKANIPSRIAFAVASQLESRIIMDTSGAEKLVGKGDMLYFPLGSGKPTRVQGCFITSAEVERVVDFVKSSGTAEYSDEVLGQIEKNAAGTGSSEKGGSSGELDDMFAAAVEVILEAGQASTSMLQRRLKLGYARAARLVDQLESQGILGPFEGAKPREILITREQWEEMKLQNPAYQ